MPAELNRLCWLDMEMSGLVPDSDRVLELALLVTDSDLNHLSEGKVLVVHQPDEVLDAMDSWNKSVHGKFLSAFVSAGSSPLCGNSICQDRRFLARWMPRLEAFFHYRNLDVSTVKELVRRWSPESMKGLVKQGKHEALSDILESVEELKYYRSTVMKI
jgi:oligoribonuclease